MLPYGKKTRKFTILKFPPLVHPYGMMVQLILNHDSIKSFNIHLWEKLLFEKEIP
jgi:hypothetical protein